MVYFLMCVLVKSKGYIEFCSYGPFSVRDLSWSVPGDFCPSMHFLSSNWWKQELCNFVPECESERKVGKKSEESVRRWRQELCGFALQAKSLHPSAKSTIYHTLYPEVMELGGRCRKHNFRPNSLKVVCCNFWRDMVASGTRTISTCWSGNFCPTL